MSNEQEETDGGRNPGELGPIRRAGKREQLYASSVTKY